MGGKCDVSDREQRPREERRVIALGVAERMNCLHELWIFCNYMGI
jgi:hypothetical protein